MTRRKRVKRVKQQYSKPSPSAALDYGCKLADESWLPITVWMTLVDGFGYVFDASTALNPDVPESATVTALPARYFA
jgi:hypothetical protein